MTLYSWKIWKDPNRWGVCDKGCYNPPFPSHTHRQTHTHLSMLLLYENILISKQTQKLKDTTYTLHKNACTNGLYEVLPSFFVNFFELFHDTAWKVSVFGIFLVRIFPHLDWIWRDTLYPVFIWTEYGEILCIRYSDWIRRDSPYLSVFSPNAGKYGPENSEYGHFSGSVGQISLVYAMGFFITESVSCLGKKLFQLFKFFQIYYRHHNRIYRKLKKHFIKTLQIFNHNSFPSFHWFFYLA